MAITGSLSFKGAALPNAYVQVLRTFGGSKGGYNAVIRIYADAATRNANENDFLAEVNTDTVAPFVAGQDSMATMYAHLSAAGGQFAGFTAC